jgi:hypothetical protein
MQAGWFGSRVEYTKVNGGRHIAAQHAGADIAIRTIYHPTIWPLRVTVMDSKVFLASGAASLFFCCTAMCQAPCILTFRNVLAKKNAGIRAV